MICTFGDYVDAFAFGFVACFLCAVALGAFLSWRSWRKRRAEQT